MYTNIDKRSPFTVEEERLIQRACKAADGRKVAYEAYQNQKNRDRAAKKNGDKLQKQLTEIENGYRKFITAYEQKMLDAFHKAGIKVQYATAFRSLV